MTSSVFRLHHHPLDAPSRRVRLALTEKGVSFDLVTENPWHPSDDYLRLSPAGEVPTLSMASVDEKLTLQDAMAICEYIEETESQPTLLGNTPTARAEVRRLVSWFEIKMAREVTMPLVGEKAFKRLQGSGQPDSTLIRVGYHNIHGHLDYIAWLTQRRNWLAGDNITLADLAAAAQFSVIDYLGDVPWSKHPEAKEWYARIKSRPSFRPLLSDLCVGILPSAHYSNLDF